MKKSYKELSNREIKERLRNIAQTSSSPEEIRKKIVDELKYPDEKSIVVNMHKSRCNVECGLKKISTPTHTCGCESSTECNIMIFGPHGEPISI